MKFSFILVTLLLLYRVKKSSQGCSKNVMQNALSGIIENLSNRNHLVTVVVENATSDVLKSAAFAISGKPHKTVSWIRNESRTFQLNSTAVVLLDSLVSMKNFTNNTIFPLNFKLSQQLIIFCHNATVKDFMEIPIERFKPPIIQHVYFLFEDSKFFRLLTFVWYQPEKCDVAELVEVNQLDKSTGKWQHGNFKLEKFSNFYGCKLDFLTMITFPEFSVDENVSTTDIPTKCMGYLCAMLRDLSPNLNYTYEIIKRTYADQSDLEKSHLFLNFHLTDMYYGVVQIKKRPPPVITRVARDFELFIAIPPGEEYSSYEKLLLPFDEATWMWITITFTSAFAVIFVMKFVRLDIASLVIGKSVTTPALNVFRVFFGISQVQCPGRNFARYHLMMFILLSLVVRTAYQGKMFEFLQQEMRKPMVSSIVEMIEQNFTFFLQKNFKKLFANLDITQRLDLEWIG